jgi:AcrR family transcriptional regulator
MTEQRTYHHGRLREALVDRAMVLLKGGARPDELSVRALAADLGVSPAAPYRHFASSDALLGAVATRGFERLAAALAPAGDDLERLGAAYLAFALAQPQVYRAMFALPREQAVADDALAVASGQAHDLLRTAVDRHLAEAGGRLSTSAASLAAWAYVHGLASLAIDGIVPPEVVTADTGLTTVLTRGL